MNEDLSEEAGSETPWVQGPWHIDAEEGGELTGVDAEIAHASDCEPFALSEYRICGAIPCPRGKKRNSETGEWEPLYPEVTSVTFDPRREDADQYRASAHLIAAATELVEALDHTQRLLNAAGNTLDSKHKGLIAECAVQWESNQRLLAKIYGKDQPQ